MTQEGEYTIVDGREIAANAVTIIQEGEYTIDWRAIIDNENAKIMLQEGEYTIPDDCRAIVANGKVKVFKRKYRTLKENDFRCRDCVHYHKGQTSTNQKSHNFGYICDMKPKEVCNTKFTNLRLYYTALKYGKICEHFERKED